MFDIEPPAIVALGGMRRFISGGGIGTYFPN